MEDWETLIDNVNKFASVRAVKGPEEAAKMPKSLVDTSETDGVWEKIRKFVNPSPGIQTAKDLESKHGKLAWDYARQMREPNPLETPQDLRDAEHYLYYKQHAQENPIAGGLSGFVTAPLWAAYKGGRNALGFKQGSPPNISEILAGISGTLSGLRGSNESEMRQLDELDQE